MVAEELGVGEMVLTSLVMLMAMMLLTLVMFYHRADVGW